MTRRENTTSAWEGISPSRFATLDQNVQADVCVIGGGIAGLTVAYKLKCEGLSVVLLESDVIGGGQTGRTTAHLSCVPDSGFEKLVHVHGKKNSQLFIQSHSAAIDEIENIIKEEFISCEFARVSGYLFADRSEGNTLEKEFQAAKDCEIVDLAMANDTPFLNHKSSSLVIPKQAQFHPLKYMYGLAGAAAKKGVRIFTGTSMTEIKPGYEITTHNGHRVTARSVVVATNVPINDRYVIHTKQAAYRTYVVGFKVPKGTFPSALVWDTANPFHYVRTALIDGVGEVLFVGGEDHKTGQENDQPFENLIQWSKENLSLGKLSEIAFRWSGQVIESVDGIAYIGRNPADSSGVYVATGDSGNGMTHGTIAGMLIKDLIVGKQNPWEHIYDPRRISLRSIGQFMKENVNSISQYKDLFTGGTVNEELSLPLDHGTVIGKGSKKIAVYRDSQGELHSVSAKCPHLGGIVNWNDTENTWDCPCHGSRFDRYGQIIEGPAITGLSPIKKPVKKMAKIAA